MGGWPANTLTKKKLTALGEGEKGGNAGGKKRQCPPDRPGGGGEGEKTSPMGEEARF